MKITSIPKNELHKGKQKQRVCVYARVSTQMLEQKQSIDKQIEVYTKQIKSNPNQEFVGAYLDYGKSGTSIKNRTGFNQMIKDCKEGLINHIITKSISRFARNTLDTLSIIKELKEYDVSIYFEKENIDTSSTYSDLLLSIYASFAEEESRSISKNVTWGMRKWLSKGNTKIPFKTFLGYDSGFVINSEQAETVRLIYRLFLIGYSISDIKNYLESHNYHTATSRSIWHYSVIQSILTNEKYIGDCLSQKTFKNDVLDKRRIVNKQNIDSYYICDHHEPIISKVDFNLAQIKLSNFDQRKALDIRNQLARLLFVEELQMFESHNINQLERDKRDSIIYKIKEYLK